MDTVKERDKDKDADMDTVKDKDKDKDTVKTMDTDKDTVKDIDKDKDAVKDMAAVNMDSVLYEGKSKIVCKGLDEDSYIIRYKNTATAFNGEKRAELEGKARLNAEISNLIFYFLEKNGIKTHLIRVLDERSILAKKAEIVMVEIIIRNIAAGSFSKKYGVPEGSELKNTSIEFSLKSDELGDPMINISQITALGIATKDELDYMIDQSLKINQILSQLFFEAGIRLVDFKLEFGRCKGEIILCDEISPDSCRLWDAKTNKKLDKDRFRRDLGDVMSSYADVLDRLKSRRNADE